MSYEPTVWKDGDLVTSAKLNKIEQGIAAGGSGEMVGMTIEENDNDIITYTLNKTWQEIWDNNYTIAYNEDNGYKKFYRIEAIDSSDNTVLIPLPGKSEVWFEAENTNDYPTYIYERSETIPK